MAYIGRGTETISNVEVLDNLTFDGSASYTLQKSSVNFVPSSANNLLISISGVVQQGNFSVSGSTITFDTTVSASDTCDWILHYGTGLITTVADGAITEAKLGSNAVTNAKITDGTIANAKLVNSSITLNGSAVSLGGSASVANTPAFHAQKTSNQSISNDTETLVSFDTELYDTDNAFDNSSTYRFTPQTAGKYYIYFNMRLNTSTDFELNEIRVQKNGSTIAEKTWRQFYFDGKYIGVVVDLNGSSDYVNVDFYQSSGGSLDISGISVITYFGGYRLIGV